MKNIKTDLRTTHTTKGGVVYNISDLKTNHLANIIVFILNRAQGGMIRTLPPMDDGKGNSCDDFTQTYYDGVAVLRRYSLLSYIIEWNKRNIHFLDYSKLCRTVGGDSTISYDWP